jgi:hypothetical protein
MTWPDLPEEVLVAERASRLVVIQPRSGAVVQADAAAAFVLQHRHQFSDLHDAARELGGVFGIAETSMRDQLEALQRQLDLSLTATRGRERYLDAARRHQAEISVPDRGGTTFRVDALGVCVEVVSHDSSLSSALAPLLEAHGDCVEPVERIDVWSGRGGVTTALNGRRMGIDPTLSLALQTVVGLLTAIAVDAGAARGLLVHAAAVDVEGTGVVLAGDSGAGKTSTTVELVRDGAGYLTDELVRVDTRNRWIVGFPRALGLEGPVRLQHADLRPSWWTDSAVDRRWTLAPRHVGRVTTETELGILVFLERDASSAPAAVELDWPEALARLMRGVYNRESLTRVELDDLIGLLASMPCFHIRHQGSRCAADQVTTLLAETSRRD